MIRINTNPKATLFLKFDQSNSQVLIQNEIKCTVCKAKIIKKRPGKWIGKCSECHNIFNFFYPFPIQEVMSQLDHRIIFNLGGVGCGKTTASSMLVSSTMRNVKDLPVFVFAQSLQQLNETAKTELRKFFLDEEFVIFNEKEWKLKNGARVIWYTSDDEQKIKGVNAGIIWLVEASKIKHAVFKETLSRMRSETMKVYEMENGVVKTYYEPKTKKWKPIIKSDRVQMIIESNPATGWIRDQLLFKSKAIIYTKNVRGIETLKSWVHPVIDPEGDETLDLVSIMLSSVDNPMMSKSYFSTLRAKANDIEEFNRDVYCDMTFKTGLVFGDQLTKNILVPDDKEIHDFQFNSRIHRWVEGIDPGGAKKGNDPTAYLLATIEDRGDDELPKVVIRDGFMISGLDYTQVAGRIWKIRSKHNWTQNASEYFVADPSSKKTVWKHENYVSDMANLNIYLDPEVDNNIMHGIRKVKTFMNAKALLIPRHLDFIWDELVNYKWSTKRRNIDNTTKQLVKPRDLFNHSLDAMRYIIMKMYLKPSQISSQLQSEKHYKKQVSLFGDFFNDNETSAQETNIYTRDGYNGSPASLKRMKKTIFTR